MMRLAQNRKLPPADFEARQRLLQLHYPPRGLIQTLARYDRAWSKFLGGQMLGTGCPLDARTRELTILRGCAAYKCEYEWGIHIANFGRLLGLTAEQEQALAHGPADAPCWPPLDRALLALVDALAERRRLDDAEWQEARRWFSEEQLFEITLVLSLYHGVSLICGMFDVPSEPETPRFPPAPPAPKE